MLPVAEQKREIEASKRRLEAVLERPVVSFAYPYGALSDYGRETIETVQAIGFESACTTFDDVVRPAADPFQLPRMLVRDWDGERFRSGAARADVALTRLSAGAALCSARNGCGSDTSIPLALAAFERRYNMPSSTPLLAVGRERELATLRAALDQALSGQAQITLLTGEPGIGKTWLARTFEQASLAMRGALALGAQCHEQPGAPAYWPWIQIFRGLGQHQSDEALGNARAAAQAASPKSCPNCWNVFPARVLRSCSPIRRKRVFVYSMRLRRRGLASPPGSPCC
jgi:hypothetical protein